ncbi:MAG: serine protease [Acidobacteria bacterium]|nr:MAG: serine protease [Acidobacteriota bacterium]
MRRLVLATVAVLFLAALLLPTQRKFVVQAVSDGERLAMYTKPAVVRTVDGAVGQFFFQPPGYQGQSYNVSFVGTGSGFILSSNGYIATNAHCVTTTHDGEDKAKQALFYQMVQQIAQQLGKDPRSLNANFIDQYSKLTSFQLIHTIYLPDGSSYPFEIKQFGAPTGESNDQGKDVAILKIEIKNAPILKVGDSDKVQLQDHITVIGYPAAADTKLLDFKSLMEATVNDGKISARKTATSGAPILQTNTAATHGNSGGPGINDQFEVIGLLTFRGDVVNNQEVQGFTFLVPSNTVMEYVKAAGASNTEGLTDTLYREGLEYYWDQRYSLATQKFEEVKRLFPQHAEVEKLIQSSQQAKSEGKERSSFPVWLIAVVVIVLLVIGLIVIIGIVIAIFARKKKKSPAGAPSAAKGSGGHHAPTPASYSPSSPSPNYSPSPAAKAQQPHMPTPVMNQGDQGMTVDLSRTIAISPELDTAPINYGSIKFISGALAGKEFMVKPDGEFVGRDSGSAQVVIPDPRISKRHLWIGVREGRVTIVDQESRNGTFVNDPKSPRVTERSLNPGDTVILGESDVARFEYVN